MAPQNVRRISLAFSSTSKSITTLGFPPSLPLVAESLGSRRLWRLPDGSRVKLTNSCWRNTHENGDDTGVSVFCNGSRFSRRGAVANASTMHVLGRNQHCF